MHDDSISIATSNLRSIVEAMTGVNPAVFTAAKGIAHAVRVAGCVEWPIENFLRVAFVVAISIAKEHDVRDGETDHAVFPWIQADRNIQAFGESFDRLEATITIAVFVDGNEVSRSRTGLGSKRVFQGAADPQASTLVKGKIHRLCDLGFRSHEIDPEPFRKPKRGLFRGRVERFRIANTKSKRVVLSNRRTGDGGCGNRHGCQ